MRLETDSGFHFDFFLAERLGMPVAEMRRRVSAAEWVNWSVYYGRKAQQRELAQRRAGR